MATTTAARVSTGAQELVNTIDSVTQISKDLEAPASLMSISAIDSIATVTQGLADLTSTITKHTSLLVNFEQFDTDCDGDAISTSLTKFLEVNEDLLGIISEKAPLLSAIPGTGVRIMAALRSLQKEVDPFGMEVVRLIPGIPSDILSETASLFHTFEGAISAYA